MAGRTTYSSIDIRKDVVNLVHAYCVLNNLKMREFVTRVLEEHLKEFNDKMKELARLRD